MEGRVDGRNEKGIEGFRLYWRWKSKPRGVGRPQINPEIRELIRKISRENPLWGVPRIQSELHLLGFDLAESTVAKYRIKPAKPPSQTWTGHSSFPEWASWGDASAMIT